MGRKGSANLAALKHLAAIAAWPKRLTALLDHGHLLLGQRFDLHHLELKRGPPRLRQVRLNRIKAVAWDPGIFPAKQVDANGFMLEKTTP